MIRKIEKLLDEQVRPALASHGGNVEIIDADNNQLFIKMIGGCHGCSASTETVKQGIQTLVHKHFPEITEVVDVTDHTSGKDPYM